MNKTLKIAFFLSFGVLSFSFASDNYNALIWDPKYRGEWYEWWYYKVVVPETNDAFYFCYGIVNPWDTDQSEPASRSYVSVGSFNEFNSFERVFAAKDFTASYGTTFVRIADNVATDKMLKGSVQAPDGGEVSWDLTIEKDWSFNAMGWSMYQDWIYNIYWYPVQAGAWMSGKINYKGRAVRLNRSPAYQDRNWGKSFPRWWAWIVSNNFNDSPQTILVSGGGRPKLFPGFEPIEGLSIGLRHNGREYIFRPTSGHVVKVDVNFGKWEVTASNHNRERIEISAYAPKEKFLLLQFMTPQGAVFNDYEALEGRIHVKLYEGSKIIAELVTDHGGIEYGSFPSKEDGQGDDFAPDFDALFSGNNNLQ
ncbi:MAG: hypothetical protein HY746_00090 [Elusimicrobia bacterium]|nr:hypothetical protein [Elusimicrobiota bacterium]